MNLRTLAKRGAIPIAVLGLAFAGCGEGSSDPGSTAEEQAVRPAGATEGTAATEARPDPTKRQDRPEAAADDRPARKAKPNAGGDSPSDQHQQARDKPRRQVPAHEQAPAGDQRQEGCPGGVTAAECEDAAAAVQNGGRSGKTSGDCPASLTAAECREVAGVAEGGGNSSGSEPTCPAGVSSDECRALAEAIRE